jgi:5'-methylthioadenosine phosphorylase
MIQQPHDLNVDTPYGNVTLVVGTLAASGQELAFLPRHGAGHSVPPHRINYRANIFALKLLGVERIVGTATVGSMNKAMPPGTFVFVDQFIDFTHARPQTFFDAEDGVVHTDMTDPYCPQLRATLLDCAEELGLPHHAHGTYFCFEGPRFETPAEIRAFALLGGDVVGMTNLPEVVLAREAGLCYACIALCTNWAAGITSDPVSHQDVLQQVTTHGDALQQLATRTLETMPMERSCQCHSVIRTLI